MLSGQIPLWGLDRLKTELPSEMVDDDHAWGFEVRLVNEDEYCCKLLAFIEPGVTGSFHYHANKKETFILLSGVVYIRESRLDISTTTREYGATFTVKPGERHSIEAVGGPALILEVSTHHEDDDTYRNTDTVTLEDNQESVSVSNGVSRVYGGAVYKEVTTPMTTANDNQKPGTPPTFKTPATTVSDASSDTLKDFTAGAQFSNNGKDKGFPPFRAGHAVVKVGGSDIQGYLVGPHDVAAQETE